MEYWRNPSFFSSFLLESPSDKFPYVERLLFVKIMLKIISHMISLSRTVGFIRFIGEIKACVGLYNSSICVRQIPFYRHMLISFPILWWIHTWIHHIVCTGAQLQCDPHESCCMQESMVFPIRSVFLRKSKIHFCFWVVWLEFKFPTEMFGITLLTKQNRI